MSFGMLSALTGLVGFCKKVPELIIRILSAKLTSISGKVSLPSVTTERIINANHNMYTSYFDISF
jgi:hypothetical protein